MIIPIFRLVTRNIGSKHELPREIPFSCIVDQRRNTRNIEGTERPIPYLKLSLICLYLTCWTLTSRIHSHTGRLPSQSSWSTRISPHLDAYLFQKKLKKKSVQPTSSAVYWQPEEEPVHWLRLTLTEFVLTGPANRSQSTITSLDTLTGIVMSISSTATVSHFPFTVTQVQYRYGWKRYTQMEERNSLNTGT